MSSVAPVLPDGFVVVVKRECATCQMVDPVLKDISAHSSPLTVYTQDDPTFPESVSAIHDSDLAVSWRNNIDTVPTLIKVVNGKEVAHAIQIPVDLRIRAMAFIPSTTLATKKARTLLPASIPFADAQRNSTNTALLMHALTIRPDLLFSATQDFLHQSYRSDAMPASFALMSKLRAAGVAAFISGAGPTVLALHTGTEADVAELSRAAGSKFEAKSLEISRSGAELL